MRTRKPIHIMIDGVDNVGKSTVIKLLSKKLKLDVIKMPDAAKFIKNRTIEDASKLYNETIVQYSNYPCIFDRGFTSSLVYSMVFKRKTNLKYIRDIYLKLDPKIIILTRIDDRGKYRPFCRDKIFNYKEKEQVNSEFLNLAVNEDFLIVNTWGKKPRSICNEILEKI